MFLTRMHLNPVRRGSRHLLASPQRIHAAVMASFPPGSTLEGAGGRVLWRVDHQDNVLTLWISSPGKPDLTHVVEQAGWPTAADPWQSVATTPLLDRLTANQDWVFRLTANPVVSLKQEGGRGKRMAHVTVAQQEEWLASRAAKWGFELLTAGVSARDQVAFSRSSDGTSRKVTLSRATFDGVLRVTDPALLRTALTQGVGKAKGYGCGLITLAPPR